MDFSVPVSRIAFGGDGVGRLPDGKVCFVPGALPGGNGPGGNHP